MIPFIHKEIFFGIEADRYKKSASVNLIDCMEMMHTDNPELMEVLCQLAEKFEQNERYMFLNGAALCYDAIRRQEEANELKNELDEDERDWEQRMEY